MSKPASVADRYISKGGRTAYYGRDDATEDLMAAASFLAWAETDGALYGGYTASEAFKAVCRLLDVDMVGLRKIALGRVV